MQIVLLISEWKVVELQIDTLFRGFYHKESESGIFTVILVQSVTRDISVFRDGQTSAQDKCI